MIEHGIEVLLSLIHIYYLPLKGTLPDDREKFLSMIDNALGGKQRIRSEYSRAL